MKRRISVHKYHYSQNKNKRLQNENRNDRNENRHIKHWIRKYYVQWIDYELPCIDLSLTIILQLD